MMRNSKRARSFTRRNGKKLFTEACCRQPRNVGGTEQRGQNREGLARARQSKCRSVAPREENERSGW
jgi:hypothetical protein